VFVKCFLWGKREAIQERSLNLIREAI